MCDTNGVMKLVWSDVYYDQTMSLIGFLLDSDTNIKWCHAERLAYLQECLRDMTEMDLGEVYWDYGERSVKLFIPEDVERDIYRLMSEAWSYGFTFDCVHKDYSEALLDKASAQRLLDESDAAHEKFQREQLSRRRRSRESSAAACLSRYVHACNENGVQATMDGYAKACGSRRVGRKTWRKYMD